MLTALKAGSVRFPVRGVAAAGLVMAGLLLVGCGGGGSSAKTSASSSASTTATTARAGSDSLDACLVGRWVETGEIDRVTINGAQLAMQGGSGVTLAFTSGGRETVEYTGSQPLTGTLNGVPYVITTTGQVRYDVSTSGTTLTFANPRYDGYKQTATVGGQPIALPAPTTPAPDFYECQDASLRQNQNGYAATYERQ